jgi:hypothetical protein
MWSGGEAEKMRHNIQYVAYDLNGPTFFSQKGLEEKKGLSDEEHAATVLTDTENGFGHQMLLDETAVCGAQHQPTVGLIMKRILLSCTRVRPSPD